MRYQARPARLLNDQRGVFGLGMGDFAAAIVLFVLLSAALEETPFAILSLPLSIVALAALSPIRLTQRRKIIRDTLRFYFSSSQLTAKRRGKHVRT
jgi:hypothetical protein